MRGELKVSKKHSEYKEAGANDEAITGGDSDYCVHEKKTGILEVMAKKAQGVKNTAETKVGSVTIIGC